MVTIGIDAETFRLLSACILKHNVWQEAQNFRGKYERKISRLLEKPIIPVGELSPGPTGTARTQPHPRRSILLILYP